MQALGIPLAALFSVIFGLMIISFPVGAYVVFNSSIETEINFDYPIKVSDFFSVDSINTPFEFELGDGFIVLWSIFIIIFTVAMFGPKTSFLSSLFPMMAESKQESKPNYLVTAIKWFAIIILISALIDFIQESMGIQTQPPEPPDALIQFFNVSLSPITEEIGFRVILIGIPLYAMFAQKSSFRLFLNSLWHPSKNLNITKSKKALILIVLVGIFFGVAHIISGEPWSIGKFAQAAASGIIIGWVYYRHGLVPALLIHWGTNYLIFSYVYLIADINEISIQSGFANPLTNTMEILFLITGILSIAIILLQYVNLLKEKKLEI